MRAVGYYNGTIGSLDEMTIPMLDRSSYFGDGCYEACLIHNGKGFAIEEHLNRFERSLRLLEIPAPCGRDELKQIFADCAREAGEGDAVLYWQCSRGSAPRKHSFPGESVSPNLTVMITPTDPIPETGTVRLMTTEDIRFTMCDVKTLNLLPNVLANQHAHERGLDGAIFVRNGIVTEGTHSNVLILKDGVLVTHPTDQYILPGITRLRLLAIAHRLGIPTREEPFSKEDLFTADEVLVTSSGTPIRSATEIDGIPVGGKAPELLALLQHAYFTEFTEETK